MVKRFLDCDTSDFFNMSKAEILESIRAAEGRVLVAETVNSDRPLLGSISNAETAAAFGADIIILNVFDVKDPVFFGIPKANKEDIIRTVKNLTGRLVGINLEPVDEEEATLGVKHKLSSGRIATVDNAEIAASMGVNILVVTGNPGTGVSNRAIARAVHDIKERLGDKLLIIAGKMHAAGSSREAGENIVSNEEIDAFIKAGADVILFPAPGTVPGTTTESIRELVKHVHSKGVMTMTAMGTSQEGADEGTIRDIALMSKMTGTDIHHIGDAGFNGMATPENITAYSVVIRGKRHTYTRIARSINR
jgi:hypothetical protein